MRVVHLTSVHARYDTRIFLKECCSLAQAGFQVSLIVADGKGNEVCKGIEILDVGPSQGRLKRIFQTTQRIFQLAKQIDANLYHFHDPELIPVGLKLKKLGKKVVFDAHEDVPKQILNKHYLNSVTSKTISAIFEQYEKYVCSQFDFVIAATPTIRDRYLEMGCRTVDINNFPILSEFSEVSSQWHSSRHHVCYVGTISKTRGICEIVRSLEYLPTNFRLFLGGEFKDSKLHLEVACYPGWQSVDELGFLKRDTIHNVFSRSIAGLVTLHPTPSYIDSLPVKMFEYMSAGIPVISSNFPRFREILEENDCGLYVDPLNPQDIAHAVYFLLNHPDRAFEMGRNGQRAIQGKYNWSIERSKLINLYESLLN